MTIKFQRAPNLKPPPVCRKAPPWPAPTRMPRGLIVLNYRYEVKPYDQPQVNNCGATVLTLGEGNTWQNDSDDCGPGQPFAVLNYNLDDDTYDITLSVNFALGVGIAWGDDEIPAPTWAPFHLDLIMPAPYDPYWQWESCRVQLDPL